MYAIFNKTTFLPIGFTDDISQFPKDALTRELDLGNEDFNLARYRWEGDYQTGRLVDLFQEKKSIVTEKEMDDKFNAVVFRKYTMEDILFALLDDDDTQLKEMRVFFNRLKKKKLADIAMYKSSEYHIYETLDTQRKREEESFK
jgi:hypothetical protein